MALEGVSQLVHQSKEVASLCNAVLHYEALRTHTVDAITWDANFTSVSIVSLLNLHARKRKFI